MEGNWSSGKLQRFAIEFDNENAVYHAGETVSGGIIVVLAAPMSMRCIRINILGRAKVHWSVRKGKNDRTHYRAQEVYFNETKDLFGASSSDSNVHLDAGNHRFDFTIRLVGTLPSSFEGEHGHVRYTIEATIDKPWKFDHTARSAFTVISILDLNSEGVEFREVSAVTNSATVECCCWVSGEVTATVKLNKRCFVPGETIFINAQIVNHSETDISHTKAQLKQYTEFLGVSDSFFSSGNTKSKWESSVVESVERDTVIAGGTTGNWTNVAFVIPSIPPSRLVGCNIINCNYVLKFYVDAQYTELKLATDLLIGTVPLRQAFLAAARYHNVITTQPTAPTAQDNEQVDLGDWNLPPPSYEECVSGTVDIREDSDSQFIRGNMNWAPKYPMYRQLSFPSQPQSQVAAETDVNVRVQE